IVYLHVWRKFGMLDWKNGVFIGFHDFGWSKSTYRAETQVLWGIYIGHFTFLVGMAATSVVLLIPAYLFHIPHMKRVILLGECLAITAVTMSLLFIFVDLGRPWLLWHALPFIGQLNFPTSILAWDILILIAYLILNLGLFVYIILGQYRNQPRLEKEYFPWMILAIILGIAIHTVTAFMLAGLPARPFWHSAILAPRFLASAFAAGSAGLILLFKILQNTTDFFCEREVERLLTGIMAFALLIYLFLFSSEWFTIYYRPVNGHLGANYLYFGLGEQSGLTLWSWSAITAQLVALIILILPPLRQRPWFLNGACLFIIAGILFEKGVGLILPAFIPTPLGEVTTYKPTWVEIQVTLGIWAFGTLLFTLLARVVVAVTSGTLRKPGNLS
ncbi:MAG: polysulfide reductase NrfD, partial [Magnetococcus sp. DMHC-6]